MGFSKWSFGFVGLGAIQRTDFLKVLGINSNLTGPAMCTERPPLNLTDIEINVQCAAHDNS